MDIAPSNHNEEDWLDLVNVGTSTEPNFLKLDANLSPNLRVNAESLFREFINIFALFYEDLQGIPEDIPTYRIKLNPTISPSHQARSCINPNYAKVVKNDLEQHLSTSFIAPVDQATWLSPIVVPKKNGKLHTYVDFRQLNSATKKVPMPSTVYQWGPRCCHRLWSLLVNQLQNGTIQW